MVDFVYCSRTSPEKEFSMIRGRQFLAAVLATVAVLALTGGSADAAQCGNGPGGFESWKHQFGRKRPGQGVGGTRLPR